VTPQTDVKGMAKHVAQHCVATRLRVLNRDVTNIYNGELKKLGITVSQFNILTALACMQPASSMQIGKILHLEKSSLCRNLDLMQRNGWIKGENQGRSLQLRTTEEGESIYAQAYPCWEQAQNECRKMLGSQIAENLQSLMMTLPDA
jgi:DNA-binding MarR family transcriptional regulator